jgi:hypothetical protein
MYRAQYTRALARAGQRERALAVADTAIEVLRADSIAQRVLRAVRQNVSDDCYNPIKVAACNDPLAGWSLAVDAPTEVADRRNKPQNATEKPVQR